MDGHVLSLTARNFWRERKKNSQGSHWELNLGPFVVIQLEIKPQGLDPCEILFISL